MLHYNFPPFSVNEVKRLGGPGRREIGHGALAQAKDGRLHILGEMGKTLSRPRGDISNFAPRITTIKIPVEKIKDIIGPGGKIIRGMQMETGAKIDVEDDGTVHVAAVDGIAGPGTMIAMKKLGFKHGREIDAAVEDPRNL